MKKFLAFLVVVTLLTAGFILVAGLFIPREYHFERSIAINAPRAEIWKNVSLFANFEKWNPQIAKDTAMKSEILGTDGLKGAVYRWNGNRETGKGTQTIRSAQPMEHVRIHLQLEEPYKMEAYTFYNLEAIGSAVKVTWGIDARIPYPFNAVSYFFLNIDEKLNQEFSVGLRNLKKLCESNVLRLAAR